VKITLISWVSIGLLDVHPINFGLALLVIPYPI